MSALKGPGPDWFWCAVGARGALPRYDPARHAASPVPLAVTRRHIGVASSRLQGHSEWAIFSASAARCCPRSKREPTDYNRLIGMLRQAGYSGWVVLEYEGREDPYRAIPKHLDKLRAAMAS